MLCVFSIRFLECLKPCGHFVVVVVVYGSDGQLVLLCLGLVLAFFSDYLLALAVPSLHGCKPGKGLEEVEGLEVKKRQRKVRKKAKSIEGYKIFLTLTLK